MRYTTRLGRAKGPRAQHSIVLHMPSTGVLAENLFFNKPSSDSYFSKLEVYLRPDDTTYVYSPIDSGMPLPASTDLVDVDEDSCKLIWHAADSLSSRVAERKLLVKQACYRPVVSISSRGRSKGLLLGRTQITSLILAASRDN
jgi:hypothetical protein